ncbi:hypothetical protein ABZ904_08495 [Streptomyces sp. NPDC046900]|uniref:hypothetical protein n=1 Tax=Streptomyces sp. NPDC046900 TaxID=3155473 RepID=UPI0033DD08E6
MNVRRCLRQIVAPTGRRRAPRRVEETVPLRVLMRPQDAMVNDLAWCPAEERNTLHAFFRLGGRQCWTCRTVTAHDPLTSTPPAGGAE